MMRFFTTRLQEVSAARYEPEGQVRVARWYWMFTVTFFTGIVIAAVGYGAWEFTRPLGATESESLIIARPRSPLDRVELQTVLQGFDERVRRFDERREAPGLSDPS